MSSLKRLSSITTALLIGAGATMQAADRIPATPFSDFQTTSGHGVANLTDGDPSTYFQTEGTQYTWGAIDLGSPHVITSLRFSRPSGSDAVLGVFQGANNRDFSDAIPLWLIDERPASNVMTELTVNCSRGVRYIRYVGPAGSRSVLGELEAYGTPGEGDDSQLWQITDLPTVVINTVNSQEPYDKEHDIDGNIIIISNSGSEILSSPGSVRERGNASRQFPKKPWRIKFDKKQNVLDAPAKAKKWTLLNNYGDKTLMRNMLAFKIAELMGMEYVPFCRPVDVILNGEFKGCYQLCDQIEVNKDRVDIDEMTPEDIEGDALTGGYLVEVDGYADQEISWFRTSHYGIPITIKSPDDDEITAAQKRYITDCFNTLEPEMKNTDPETGYRRLFDNRSFIQHMLVNEVAGNTDCYWSTYMTKRRGDDKIYTGPVWDFDLGFDNDNRTFPVTEKSGDGFLWDSGVASAADGMRYFAQRILLKDPGTKAEILKVWSEARENGLSADELTDLASTYAADLDDSQRLNFMRWPILSHQVHQNPRAAGSYAGEVNWVKEYIKGQMAHLDQVIGYEPAIGPDPGHDAIETIEPDDTAEGIITTVANTIVTEGFADGVSCEVYRPDGTLVTVFATGDTSGPLSQGIYIVRAGSRTVKLLVR